jgi:hypothetical protein
MAMKMEEIVVNESLVNKPRLGLLEHHKLLGKKQLCKKNKNWDII